MACGRQPRVLPRPAPSAERGALLVVDEVQTGFGRTGRTFACEHHDLIPDIMAMGRPSPVFLWGSVLHPAGSRRATPGLHPTAQGATRWLWLPLPPWTTWSGRACPGRRRRGPLLRDRLSAINARAIREIPRPGIDGGVECRTRCSPTWRP